jgi:hypothetical protein
MVQFTEIATVNIEMYGDILCRFGDAVTRKYPENGEPRVGLSFTTMLQEHRSVMVKDFSAKNNLTALEYPP